LSQSVLGRLGSISDGPQFVIFGVYCVFQDLRLAFSLFGFCVGVLELLFERVYLLFVFSALPFLDAGDDQEK